MLSHCVLLSGEGGTGAAWPPLATICLAVSGLSAATDCFLQVAVKAVVRTGHPPISDYIYCYRLTACKTPRHSFN